MPAEHLHQVERRPQISAQLKGCACACGVRQAHADHEPAGQGEHSAADDNPLSAPKVPAGQVVGIDDPAGQYEPLVHSSGSMVRAVGQK